MRAFAKAAARSALERAGYWFTDKSVLPFGVDYLWDIQRLARRHSIGIRCAFDIGAHGGDTALEFLDAFPSAEIYSFEPHPDAFAILQREAKSQRVHAHRLAASNRRGAAQFFVLSEPSAIPGASLPSANNSLVANTQFGAIAGHYSKTIEVTCETVDDFCVSNGIASIDLLKIDTEGHEEQVLEGASKTLAERKVAFVFIEFQTILQIDGATGGALAPCAQILEPLGFKFMSSYQIHMLDRPLYAGFNALYFRPRSA